MSEDNTQQQPPTREQLESLHNQLCLQLGKIEATIDYYTRLAKVVRDQLFDVQSAAENHKGE